MKFLDCFSDWLLLWVSAAFANVLEDIQLRTNNLKAFQGLDGKELGGEEGNIGVVTFTGAMVGSAQECIWFAHGLAGFMV